MPAFALLPSNAAIQDGVLDALGHVCEEVGCVENQREAAALLCALAVPYENKLPLAGSGSAEPLMLMCQSVDVEVCTPFNRLRNCFDLPTAPTDHLNSRSTSM